MAVLHLTAQMIDTEANILAAESSNSLAPYHWYFATDTGEYRYAIATNQLSGPIPSTAGFIDSVADSGSVDHTVSSGELSSVVKISGTAGNILGLDGANGLYVGDLQIAAGSANHLDYNPATRELSLKALSIIKIEVDGSSADLATHLAANYTGGDEYQEGDMIILTSANEAWVHNGGGAGTAADFTQIEMPNLSDAYIRSLFDGGLGIEIDAGGTVSVDLYTGSNYNALAIANQQLHCDIRVALVNDNENLLGGGIGSDVTLQNLLDELAANPGTTYTFANGLVESGGTVTFGGGSASPASLTSDRYLQSSSGSKYIYLRDSTGNAQLRLGMGGIGTSPLIIYDRNMEITNNGGIIVSSGSGQRWLCKVNDDGAWENIAI